MFVTPHPTIAVASFVHALKRCLFCYNLTPKRSIALQSFCRPLFLS